VITFAEQWDRSVRTTPDSTFLLFEGPDGEVSSWSYRTFDDTVGRVVAWLAAHGVARGDSVHLALTNSPTFVAVWLAAIKLGAWIVPSDPMATTPELADHIARTSPLVGFCATSRADVYRQAAQAMTVVEIDETDGSLAWAAATEHPVPVPEHDPRDRAAVMFTSGTTGRPKGVVITQANYAFAGEVMAAAAALGADDRQLVVLPLFHANAQYYSFASAIAVGASVALMHTFSASRFIDQAARHEATHASLFAGPVRMILARGAPPTDRHGLRLRHCWFAQNLTEGQYETIAAWMGCRPRQLYGMTETIPAVLTDAADDPRPDTMGYVSPRCVVGVQDATGRTCGPDEVGEIVVGGSPGLTLFDGYLDDEATTASAYRDGWFLTGYRARRDAAGRHRFEGRRSDVLKVAGENVSIVEVEAAIALHPAVFEVAVVGLPDAIRDEVPVAYVVLRPDAESSPGIEADLARWCADRLGKAKRPRSFFIVDELPRTSVGKIRTYLLRQDASVRTVVPGK
jgi:crotonobetaine/carnitine-CoA ligase